jgi:large-conductance mechanosensitive channel
MSAVESVNKIIDVTESTVKSVDKITYNTVTIIVTFLVSQSKAILKFLIEKNVVSAGIAIVVGTQVGRITGAFVENLLSPFINLIIGGETKNLEDFKIEVMTVQFKVGMFLSQLIQFIITMSMVYYVFKLTQISNIDSLLNQSVAIGTLAANEKTHDE